MLKEITEQVGLVATSIATIAFAVTDLTRTLGRSDFRTVPEVERLPQGKRLGVA